MKITIGARTAKVSLVYAKSVAKLLETAGAEVKLKPIPVIGDSLDVGLAGQRGVHVFTKEIDEALAKGEIDLAVHDMSHLAATLPPNVSIAAVPARLDPSEAFLSNKAKRLAALPKGARIGVAGASRAPQLAHMGRDFQIMSIITDAEANLRAVSDGAADAVIMSSAELMRLGVAKAILERLPLDKLIPAVGQGALAVEVRSDRKDLIKFVAAACHHPASGVSVKAERAFLKAISQAAGAVFAANAEVVPSGLSIVGFVSRSDGSGFASDKEGGKIEEAAELGKKLAEKILKKFQAN